MDPYFRKRPAGGSDGSPPNAAWLFAQAVLGKPVPSASRQEADARARREHLEWLAQISPEDARRVRGRLSEEVDIKAQQDLLEWVAEITGVREAGWDPSLHPRAPQGQPDGGQWVAKGGGSSAGSAVAPSSPLRTAAFRAGQSTTKLAAFGGAPSTTWPTTGPTSSWLPKVGSGVGAGAGAAAGIGAGAFLGGLRNASMGAYWARVPGTQAMPSIWVYELEKRVRAGKLSREDAIGIFNTAVLGAEAQGFRPTGGTMSAVHQSATGFLGKAEAIYFARKKEAAGAKGDADAKDARATPQLITGEALATARREFEGMKRQLWRKEAEENPQKYTPEQLEKMRRGDAPKGSDGRPMEIHHKKPLSEGGTNTWDNFEFLTHTDHRRKPNFKPNHPNLPRGRAQ
jgi:hypothetical protein